MNNRKEWGEAQYNTFLAQFSAVSLQGVPDEVADCEAVIIEPRVSELRRLELVVRNVAYYLPEVAITIMCSKANIDGVRKFVGEQTGVRVEIVCNLNVTRDQYSEYLCRADFWQQFIARGRKRVLIFQTDTGVRRGGLEAFMQYDYIGAGWPWNGRVGNGGFSLRCPQACIDVCKAFTYKPGLAEDLFFSQGMYVLGKKIAGYLDACAFAVEYDEEKSEDPLGFHQGYRWWSEDYTRRMLSICEHIKEGLGTGSVNGHC